MLGGGFPDVYNEDIGRFRLVVAGVLDFSAPLGREIVTAFTVSSRSPCGTPAIGITLEPLDSVVPILTSPPVFGRLATCERRHPILGLAVKKGVIRDK